MKKQRKKSKDYAKDLVERLKEDEEAQLLYLQASFEENQDHPLALLFAIRSVAEARGFSNFAKDTKLNRENLYRALSDKGNPRFFTLIKILDSLGLRLALERKSS